MKLMAAKQYTSNAGNFENHADAAVAVRCVAHRRMEHIPSFNRSHWMAPSGECSHCIATAAAMVNDYGRKHKTLTKTFLAS
jgi:hypothetical protein